MENLNALTTAELDLAIRAIEHFQTLNFNNNPALWSATVRLKQTFATAAERIEERRKKTTDALCRDLATAEVSLESALDHRTLGLGRNSIEFAERLATRAARVAAIREELTRRAEERAHQQREIKAAASELARRAARDTRRSAGERYFAPELDSNGNDAE